MGGGYDTDGLAVVDWSDPSDPEYASVTVGDVTETGHGCAQSGDYAYVAGRESGSVEVFDVSDPTDPDPVAYYQDTDQLLGIQPLTLDESNDALYGGVTGDRDPQIDDGPTGLATFDASDPENIELTSFISDGIDSLSYSMVHDGYLFAAPYEDDEMGVFYVGDPLDPELVNTDTWDGMDDARGVDIDPDREVLFIGSASRMLTVDISDPNDLELLDNYTTSRLSGTRGIALSDDYQHVAVAARGADQVTIVDATDETHIFVEEEIEDDAIDSPYGMAIDDTHLHTGNTQSGDGDYHVIDVPWL